MPNLKRHEFDLTQGSFSRLSHTLIFLKLTMKTSLTLRIFAGIAVLFGILTINSGGQVLFGDEATRANTGQVIAFVLWFNFCAGFAYVLAGIGLWFGMRWASLVAIVLAITTALLAVGLLVYIFLGGGYEMHTLVAMALRLGFLVLLARLARQEFETSTTLKRAPFKCLDLN